MSNIISNNRKKKRRKHDLTVENINLLLHLSKF